MRAAQRAIAYGFLAIALAGSVKAVTPEQACNSGLEKAVGKYAYCSLSLWRKIYFGGGDEVALANASLACRRKFICSYVRLRAKALASPGVETCDQPRFVDNGDGTITDNLSCLQW